jgi:formyl-CoA transferase/CoA:oxalate CoA-transferase
MPALADDPRFATNGDRVDRRAELRPILADRLAERSTAEWVAVLDAAGIPNGAIADVADAFASAEAQALAMTAEVEHPAFGVLRQVGIPLVFESTPGAIRSAPPLLGEHTDEVLTEAGVSAEELAALRRDGVI